MKKKTLKRTLSMMMVLTLLVGILPVSVWAVDHTHDASCGYAESAPCKHAQGQHDDTCGYAAPSVGSGCNHSCGDGLCNYAAGTSGSACGHAEGCPEMEPGTICDHTDGCGYSEGTPEVPCDHTQLCTSGGDCGYIAPSDGSSCTHETHNDACGYSEGSDCNYGVAPIDDSEDTCSYDNSYQSNENGHWQVCVDADCSLSTDIVNHINANDDNTCDTCGYVLYTEGGTTYTVIYTDGVADAVIFDDLTYTVAEGAVVPTYVPPDREGFIFDGWNPTYTTTVTSDTTFIAIWRENTVTGFTVTYTDGVADVVVFADQVYDNISAGNATPSFEGTPTRDGYTFAGWSPTVVETVTSDATYTAQWTENAAAHVHDWGKYKSNGNGYHTRTCTTDSSHYQTEKCSGGAATCKDLATCSECGATYGSLNSANHSGGTEVRNAKDATETENGYTGDTYCLGCGYKMSEGDTIPATGSGDDDDDTHTHNYSYYKYDGTNHWKMCGCGQGQAGSVKAHTLVDKQNNNGHWKECTVCNYYSDAQAHVYSNDADESCNDCGYTRHVHSFPTATCIAPAVCSCGSTYEGKNPNNHTGGTEIRNAAEATIVADGYTGDTYCKGCGAKLKSGEVIPKKTQISENTDTGIVTFTPGEGLVLPEDAVLVVDPHTPSEENIYFLLPPNTDTEYVSVASDDIALVTPFMLNGVTFYQYDVVVFGGEEFVVVGNTDDGLHLVSFSDGNSYFFDGEYLRLVDVAPRIDIEKRDNQKLNINGVTYDVVAALDGQASLDRLILYHNGKPAGQYHLTTGKATFNEGFDPEMLKAQQNVNDLGTVTPGESPIDGLEPGKTYNVSVIGSNDISVPGYDEAVLNSIKAETEEEKAAKKEVERLKADMEAKKAAVDQLDATDPDHMKAWAAWDEAETAYKEALAELAALANLQSATVTQKFQIPDALIGRNNVKFVAVHDINPHATALAAAKFKMEEARWVYWEYHGDSYEERQRLHMAAERAAFEWAVVQELYDEWEKEHAADTGTGNELGTVTIAEDGKSLTATYTVSSFSPFTVYAFTEADEPEIKTLSATIVDGSDDVTESVVSADPIPKEGGYTWLWIVVAILAAGAAVTIVIYTKKKKK